VKKNKIALGEEVYQRKYIKGAFTLQNICISYTEMRVRDR